MQSSKTKAIKGTPCNIMQITNVVTIDQSLISSSRSPSNKYVGQVAYEKRKSREWLMHFMAAKHLNVLLEVIGIYIYIYIYAH